MVKNLFLAYDGEPTSGLLSHDSVFVEFGALTGIVGGMREHKPFLWPLDSGLGEGGMLSINLMDT